MAGDWMKVEKATLDKPEVLQMACLLGVEPETIFGKLFRVWAWFDTHTEDGHAPTLTAALLDRIAGQNGLCKAMFEVNWLQKLDVGLALPNFDRHNGKSAKNRALAMARMKKSRACYGASVTKTHKRYGASVTKASLEKRREENKKKKGVSFPAELDTEEFRSAWATYESYRTERNLPRLTATSVNAKLAELAPLGSKTATASVLQSVANGWQGVFPVKATAAAPDEASRKAKLFAF